MNIASTQYSLETQSFEIYLSGCDGACNNLCHNKEIWDFDLGINYKNKVIEISDKVSGFSDLIQWIWILGGEPLLQVQSDLIDLLKRLKTLGKPIVLFTRFEMYEISDDIKLLCDYIKTGKYNETLKVEKNKWYGVNLSTSNQKIWKKEGYRWV